MLAEKTGTPVPTIHHYRHLGLLPEATELASNRFLYDDRHVEALIVIRLLRERRNLPLEAIREALPELLSFNREGAFRPDMWDEVIVHYLERSGPAVVSSRLVAAAREAFCPARLRRRERRRHLPHGRHRQGLVLPLFRLEGGDLPGGGPLDRRGGRRAARRAARIR